MATYTAQTYCQNCRWTGEVTPTKGEQTSEAQCPTCECNTLQLDIDAQNVALGK